MKMKNGSTKWLTVSVNANFGWPTERSELKYKGHKFLIRPETKELEPTISVFSEEGLGFKEGLNLINRFLSSLAWSKNSGVHVITAVGSSTDEPIKIGKCKITSIANPEKRIYLPTPNKPKAMLALAIYREAMSVNSIPYQFLGFFKILNILYSNGEKQKKWINENIDKIKDHRAAERYETLSKEISDFGSYLYHQGRCAVAHAFSDEVVDPDVAEESKRLEEDIYLMKALSKLMISQEFGLKTDSQFLKSIRYATEFPEEYVEIDYKNNGV